MTREKVCQCYPGCDLLSVPLAGSVAFAEQCTIDYMQQGNQSGDRHVQQGHRTEAF